QGVVLAGLLGTVVEIVQGDVVGTVAAGALTAIAGTRIWRNNRSSQIEVEADEAAVRVAGRRGYAEAEAAQHLLSAIEAVAQMEGRPTLDFMELLRRQNLQAIAGLSSVGIPETLREK
ncbi:MAG: DUF3318 domain-containing protein, partial [Xenococcaceae cyanobacterium]